jgi:hypothetical protein
MCHWALDFILLCIHIPNYETNQCLGQRWCLFYCTVLLGQAVTSHGVVWNNSGMTVSGGKIKELGENTAPLWISLEVTWGWTRVSVERSQCLQCFRTIWTMYHYPYDLGWVHKVTHALQPFSDLLYVPICFIQTVVSYPWQNTVLSYMTECHDSPLVPWKCLPKQRNLNSAVPFTIFSCGFLVVHVSPTRTGELNSHCQQSLMQVNAGVLPSAPIGLFATLLLPPQWHAAFGMMPHTLASVDQSPVCRPRTLPPPHDEDAWGWILEGMNNVENMLENIFDGRRMCM